MLHRLCGKTKKERVTLAARCCVQSVTIEDRCFEKLTRSSRTNHQLHYNKVAPVFLTIDYITPPIINCIKIMWLGFFFKETREIFRDFQDGLIETHAKQGLYWPRRSVPTSVVEI